jgi:hypothetical protein
LRAVLGPMSMQPNTLPLGPAHFRLCLTATTGMPTPRWPKPMPITLHLP